MITCEQCGKPEHKSKLKKKRYCSPACVRQAKVSVGEQVNELIIDSANGQTNTKELNNKLETVTASNRVAIGDDKMQIEVSVAATAVQNLNNSNSQASNITTTTQNLLQPNDVTSASVNGIDTPQMINWTVSDVCEFIKNLPGCSDYVDDFEQQEIDGQALLLLKENHLVNAMGMKLGPALKIVAAAAAANTSASATTATTNITPEREAQ
ncbi:polyhomeotic-proximal chromatin protein-like [Teleopsis dalmanni]|nr:polyhomeotic-proximal chromatin protein-like [Teleopsis dalmanni]